MSIRDETRLLLDSSLEVLSREGESKLFQELIKAKKKGDHDEASRVENIIVRSNLRLVVSLAQRSKMVSLDPHDRLSAGLMCLVRCINGFDPSKGFKFSTYLTRSVLREYQKMVNAQRDKAHGDLNSWEAVSDWVPREDQFCMDLVMDLIQLREVMNSNAADLTDDEEFVLMQRFGLDDYIMPKSLKELGVIMGVSHETIHNIQVKALQKLRAVMEDEQNE